MTLVIGKFNMPDPGLVRQPEYTAIHQALAEALAKAKPEDHLAEAEYILDRMRTWVDDIQDKLERVHGNYQQGTPASSVDPN